MAWDVMMAAGLTVTVTVNTVPVQLPDVGVILYVAVSAPAAPLLSVAVRLLPVPAAAPVMSDWVDTTLHA